MGFFFFGDMAKGSRSNRSRKGKKAWRKNVDVTDVEDVARLRSTTNEQLFVVDKPVRAPVLSRKARKQLISSRTLYSDAISTPIGKNKHTSGSTTGTDRTTVGPVNGEALSRSNPCAHC